MDIKNNGARYAFVVRWSDPMTQIVWMYQFMYHTSDRSIEMYDIKNSKTFLRRVAYPALSLEQLYIGSTILVYSRQLFIEDYGDDFTRKHLRGLQETTLAMIKPDAFQYTGQILEFITANGLLVKNLRMCQLSLPQAEEFYKIHKGKPFFQCLTQLIASGPIVAMELVGENAVYRWRMLLGPTSTEVARIKAPSSIRAQFGTDCTRNACHGSDSHDSARLEICFYFSNRKLGMCARFCNCSVGIVKPHAVTTGSAGVIISRVMENFDVTAMELAQVSRATAMEFYEVYRGIVPDFLAMTFELGSGDFIAMEIADKQNPCANPVNKFRDLCGPADPCIARSLRPHTIRAEFGINKVKKPSTAQISKKMASLSRSTFSCTSMLWMAETPLLWCPKPHVVRKILSLQKQMKTLHLVLPLVPVLAHPQDRPLVHPPKAIEVHLQDFLIAELNEALSLNLNFAASPL